jgi:uncharacterized membrane protein
MAQALRDTTRHAGHASDAVKGASESSPLQAALQSLLETATNKAMTSVTDRVGGATERLTDYAQDGGGGLLSAVTGVDKLSTPLKAAVGGGVGSVAGKVKDSIAGVAGSLTGSKDKGGDKVKVTNIVEQIDVGVPIDLAYEQWTLFSEYPKFMKKVENVEQVSDEKLEWKAQVFWSHRTWESTITEQVPNERIVWRSKGDKGYVDGAVTFHELAPDLTRIIVVLEYHPKGLFERTGNLWRAQGRRVRLELKHFQRHVMIHTVLHPDDVEGWQGEIRDGEVVSSNGSKDNDSGKSARGDQSAEPKPRKTTGRSGSDGSAGRRAAKGTTTGRRPAAKAASSGSSGAKKASRSTSSTRKQPTKASTSSRRRTPAKKRS